MTVQLARAAVALAAALPLAACFAYSETPSQPPQTVVVQPPPAVAVPPAEQPPVVVQPNP